MKEMVILCTLLVFAATFCFCIQASNAGIKQTQGLSQVQILSETLGNVTNRTSFSTAEIANRTSAPLILNETTVDSFPGVIQFIAPRTGLQGLTIINVPYKVTVTFDSITVNSDHDTESSVTSPLGSNSRGGEWHMGAFVQGKVVDLNAASDGKLWDVDDGDTINFEPGTEVTLDMPKTRPLSIMTLGTEQDCGCHLIGGCDFLGWLPWEDFQEKIVQILSQPESQTHNWQDSVSSIQIDYHKAISDINDRGGCQLTLLGFINKIYKPPGQSYEPIGWGEGAHTHVVSSNGDFTLRYTITVVPPPRTITGLYEGGFIEPDYSTCTNNLAVTNATSSGSQSTAVSHDKAIDNNPSTRWVSTNIPNPRITLDLGAIKSVCSVDIAWFDGVSHQYRFNVSTSTDGNTFTNVLTGTSTGTTTSPEKYTFTAPQQARFVKVTITESTPGSPNSIAQISEVDVFSNG
jgi:F5/8 type C domain